MIEAALTPRLRRAVSSHTGIVRTIDECLASSAEPRLYRVTCDVQGGDDLLGFMRGFLYAGARSLLLSLWNVNDESTLALMVHFYREWQKGAAKSCAFRSAMLSVRDEHPHPFYWAPFVLVGNP